MRGRMRSLSELAKFSQPKLGTESKSNTSVSPLINEGAGSILVIKSAALVEEAANLAN